MRAAPFSHEDRPGRDELVELYSSVGWTAYTDDPDVLAAAVEQSTFVATARSPMSRLLGLIRCICDAAVICYVQDLPVHPEARRPGIGRGLLSTALQHFSQLRPFVLRTDDDPTQRALYWPVGPQRASDVGLTADGRLTAPH